MKKSRMLVVAMLVFMMSAQTVLGAAVPKANAENEAAEAVLTEEQVSENELQPEDIITLDEIVKETDLKNEWNSYGVILNDIKGSQVNMNGEEGCIKIVTMGSINMSLETAEVMGWLEQQFAGNPQVKLIGIDRSEQSANMLIQCVNNNPALKNLKRTVIVPMTTYQKMRVIDYWGAILDGAFGEENWDSYGFPQIYVIDSRNRIRFISIGNSTSVGDDEGLYQLADYVKGMLETADLDEVEAFVTRLYAYALGRKPDTAGLNDWVTKLKKKQIAGAAAARGFFDSDELKNRKLSDWEYVTLLYKVMMDREPETLEVLYWVDLLEDGVSRMGVFNGFAGSTEFDNICKEYGIDRGAVTATEGRDKNYGVTQFVSRLYTQALGRSYDVDGLNDWCNRIVSKTWSVTDVSTTGFFHSREFANKNLNNEQYVKVLYRTFLGREYDAAGLKDWVGKLNSGAMSRDEVLKGFSYSTEFANIMKQYGL